jgi:hypothetical protein
VTRNFYFQIAAFSLIGLLFAAETGVILRVPLSAEPISTRRNPLRLEEVHTRIAMPENLTATRAEIKARPLFFKSRRPYQPPAPQTAETAPPTAATAIETAIAAESLTLKGVFLGSPFSRALIVSPANPNGIWVAHGGEIEGWKIEDVAASQVRLAQQQKTAVLTLYHNEKSR